MKTSLITTAAIAAVMMLSATAFAGGENCPSKSGAHKDMSAAVSKDDMDHHGWVASQEAVTAEPAATSGAEAKQETPAQTLQGVLKI